MTREQNVFAAKKMLSELIYNSAYIEGCNITFPQTQTILDGMKISGVSVSDIQTVINLRDAWRYVLSNLDADPFSIEYLCGLNENISRNESLEWGVLRRGTVAVSGTTYIPPIPKPTDVEENLTMIKWISDPVQRAASFMLWVIKAQLFWDGNKRTATTAANAVLIKSGSGLFTIDETNAEEFNELLHRFYQDDNAEQRLNAFFVRETARVTERFNFGYEQDNSIEH